MRDRTINLQDARIRFVNGGAATIWNDGSTLRARPHVDDAHYSVIAHRCGYSDDLTRYTQEHEFAHLFISERLLRRPSCLWFAANQLPVQPGRAACEEAMAQLLQRWLRANEEPIIADVDWHGLKRDALALLEAPL